MVWPILANPILANPFLANPFFVLLCCGWFWCGLVFCVVVFACFVLCVCSSVLLLLLLCVCVWVCSGPLRRTPLRRTPLRRTPLRPPSAGPPSAGPPSAGPTAQNFALFFPSPATIFILFSLSCWSFSLNFGGVFEDRDPQMCTFGLSGCRVKPRRPHQTGPPGLAHDSPRTPNVHI